MYKAAYCLQILDQRDTALEIAQAALALVDSNDHTIVQNLEAVIKACLEIPDEDDAEVSEHVDTHLRRAAEAAESGDYDAAVSQLTMILTMTIDMDQSVYALKLRIYAYTQVLRPPSISLPFITDVVPLFRGACRYISKISNRSLYLNHPHPPRTVVRKVKGRQPNSIRGQ